MRKLLLLILSLAGVAVLSGFDYSGDCSAANGGCQTGDNWIANNGNEVAIALNLLEARTFHSDLESSADGVGGFANAVTTCEADPNGGLVIPPRGIVVVNRATATEVPPLTKCHVQGYGSQVSGAGPAGQYIQGNSVFRLSGTAANPFIRIEGDGIYVGKIGIEFVTPDTTNIGIKTSDASVGSNFLSGVIIDQVNISGQNQGSNTNGIALLFEDCLKCEVRGGEFKRMTSGIQINGATQASPMFAVKTRENAFGVEFTSTWLVMGATQPIFGLTSEGNTQQVRVQASANGLIELYAPYFEPSTVGTQSERAGIFTNSALAVFHVYGGSLMLVNDRMDPSRDFVQTVNQGGTARGPHIFDGFKWVTGGSTPSGATTEVLVRNPIQIGAGTYVPAFAGGRFFGDTTTKAVATCTTEMAAENRMMPGDECLQGSGASTTRWGCLDPDGVTANGYCDNAAEIIEYPGGAGGGSPGAPANSFQYNDGAGGFAGDAAITRSAAGEITADNFVTPDVPGSNVSIFDDNPTGIRPCATVTAGTGCLYAVDDGSLYYKNDSQVETELTGGGGGGASVIASGAEALATALIGSGACATTETATATGVLTTDIVQWSFNADTTAVTGYTPATAGGLSIRAWPTANNVNFAVCNPTAAGITPGAVTLNWQVVR